MSPALKGKVAVITGASRGLGKAFALRFAEEGANILITTTNLKRAEGTINEIKAKGMEVAVVEADIAIESDTKKIADEAVKKYGTVDILVNNAAIWGGLNITPWDAWTTEQWDQIFTVNVRGTWLVTKAIAPIMVKAGKGKIINIASNIAKVPAAQLFLPYSCGKGALYTMTQALAHALGESGINVKPVWLSREVTRYSRLPPVNNRCTVVGSRPTWWEPPYFWHRMMLISLRGRPITSTVAP